MTRYRLTDDSEDASLFYLNEETGRLYAMTRFDRETRDTYQVGNAVWHINRHIIKIYGLKVCEISFF